MKEALIDDVLAAHREIMRALHASAASCWLELELTMAQLRALMALADDSPSSIGSVAETLQIGLPTASHLVDRLVVAGLAERAEDPTDRRRTLARLSPAGEELIVRLRQGGREHLHAWLRQLDETDLVALRAGLRAIQRIAAQERAAAGEHRAPSVIP